MMARHTPGVQQKVKQGKVGIAGAGGLGSLVAIALVHVDENLINFHWWKSESSSFYGVDPTCTLKQMRPAGRT